MIPPRTTFDLAAQTGLTAAEVAARLKAEGRNELPAARRGGLLAAAMEVAREPMFLMLVACGVIYLLLGNAQDALMLLGFVFVVMGITLYQTRKTERALEALRDLSSPRALVVRDGHEQRIAGRDVVRGDVLVLHEGDRVPADAVLRQAVNLTVDESLLTGESAAVRKQARPEGAGPAAGAAPRPGGDDLPHVFSGTLIVQGRGVAEVTATGPRAELGRIGRALQAVGSEDTQLQLEMTRLARAFALLGLIACAMVVVFYALHHARSDPHPWLDGLMAGLTLAMATLPEEFPVVLTIFLAMGAWRLARSRALTRRGAAIEALGAATVLCVDKTGTLTQNRMAVARLYARGAFLDVPEHGATALPEAFHALVEYGILASQRDPFDPMDKAIAAVGQRFLRRTEHLHADWTLIQEYPLSRDLLALSHVWQSPDGADYAIAAKGAPEAVFDLCHLPEGERAELLGRVRTLADDGLRVLGVARAQFRPRAGLPDGQHAFAFEFVGLVGLADPIRPGVPEAVRECRAAGIRVVMITGDYAGTARHIAARIGLPSPETVLTGAEIDRLDDEALRVCVADGSIFARVVPEQKLRLVQAFKARGEIVAMTGDGVNDAPALKAAHIGVAMGGRGTDVAREAAAIVLLDDDFSTIVRAVRLGRRIFDNIRKATAYILAVHVPIAGLSLLPVLFGWPLVLLPVHILFLELIIDPACSTVFEAEPAERDVMARPPRPRAAPLFDRRTVGLSLLQGVSVLLIVLGVFAFARSRNGEADARALAFGTLVVANLGLIVTNRSWNRSAFAMRHTPNRALAWVIGGTLVCLAAALYVPFLRTLFRFSLLHPIDLVVCVVAAVVSIAWFEGLKMLRAAWRAASPLVTSARGAARPPEASSRESR